MDEYNPILKPVSRNLRNEMTEDERIIWSHIRRKQMSGVQFYRQKPIDRFVVDFYAPAIKLVLEIDGSQHQEINHAVQDKNRDAILGQLGIHVLRIDNNQVRFHLSEVLEKIHQIVEDLK
jgi:very-short-patch-repair endonuclease